jgi:hypothetical protein
MTPTAAVSQLDAKFVQYSLAAFKVFLNASLLVNVACPLAELDTVKKL